MGSSLENIVHVWLIRAQSCSWQCEGLAKEGVQITFRQLDGEDVEARVVKVVDIVLVTCDFVFSLTKSSLWVKQISVWATETWNKIICVTKIFPSIPEYSVSTEDTWCHFLANIKLITRCLLTVVSRLATGIQRTG